MPQEILEVVLNMFHQESCQEWCSSRKKTNYLLSAAYSTDCDALSPQGGLVVKIKESWSSVYVDSCIQMYQSDISHLSQSAVY